MKNTRALATELQSMQHGLENIYIHIIHVFSHNHNIGIYRTLHCVTSKYLKYQYVFGDLILTQHYYVIKRSNAVINQLRN